MRFDMVFSSLIFIYAFLPLCLLITYLVRSHQAKNIVLLLFSLFFYAWGEPVWVVLMILTGLFIYGTGLKIDQHRGTPRSKAYLILAIVGALASLIFFKYAGFLLENLNVLFNWHLPIPRFNLPIGISFYTFQILTYAIDLYRGHAQLATSAANLLLYEALFPQLIAGPIVRYADIAEQINHRQVTPAGFSDGIGRFLIGLAKKVLIANMAGELVAQTLGSHLFDLGVLDAWLGILAYSIQIYFDFSGYSDMAIGLGQMFGFQFKENFNYPFIAVSVTDFWRRWHISLGTFFRDYVYIPMGGSRKRQTFNLFVVWFLTGLWHGASWNFILWGLYFFILFFLERKAFSRLLAHLPVMFGRLYASICVFMSWVLFYFTDLDDIATMFKLMFGFSGQEILGQRSEWLILNNLPFLIIALLASTPVFAYLGRRIHDKMTKNRQHGALAVVTISRNLFLLFFSTATLVGSSYNPFLYFRF